MIGVCAVFESEQIVFNSEQIIRVLQPFLALRAKIHDQFLNRLHTVNKANHLAAQHRAVLFHFTFQRGDAQGPGGDLPVLCSSTTMV